MEDTAHIIMGFDKDKSGYQLVGSLNMDFIRHDTLRTCIAIGDKGSLKWDGVSGKVSLFKKEDNRWQTLFTDDLERNYTYREEVKHFIQCIEKDKKPLVPGKDGELVIKVIEAARHSSHSLKTVYLEQETGFMK